MKCQFLDPIGILDGDDFNFVTTFLKKTGREQVGWHYVVDLVWIYSKAKNWPRNFRVLDAGGGNGPTQFLLAEMGFTVTNIDLVLRKPKARIRDRYQMSFETVASYQDTPYVEHLESVYIKQRLLRGLRRAVNEFTLYQYFSIKKYCRIHDEWRRSIGATSPLGRLDWKRANLCDVPEISSSIFDAVVSLSSLEHIPIELLPKAWAEIMRMCRSDAKMAITTSATEKIDTWFHSPSKGYCFSEADLLAIFGALPGQGSSSGGAILEKYQKCSFLEKNLANFYHKSGENGMPWGKWEPKYFPVGLFR